MFYESMVLLSALVCVFAAILLFSPLPFPGFDYNKAISIHAQAPKNPKKVNAYQFYLNEVLRGDIGWNLGAQCVFIQTDPMEDLDDTMLFWVILHQFRMMHRDDGNIFFCLSAGLVSPAERLAYLKRVFPQLATVEFGVKYGSVTFLEDKNDFDPVMPPIDLYLNCGPSSTAVKAFVAQHFVGAAVFVGTEADGTASDGPNQRSTDTEGKLTPDASTWNWFKGKIRNFKVLNVDESRFVLFPRFDTFGESEYETIPHSYPEIEKNAWDTARMFIVSRPSPPAPKPVIRRINTSNSVFVAQAFKNMLVSVPRNHPSFRRGLNYALKYSNLDRSVYMDSVLPIVATCLLGGVYNDTFGFSPHLKSLAPCLVDTVALDLNLRAHCTHFTPAYDVLALLIGMNCISEGKRFY